MAALRGSVIPPNFIDVIIEQGRGTDDLLAFFNNLAKTAPLSGNGTPEGNIEGAFLQLYTDIDNIASPGTFLFQKTNDSGKTGWKLV